MEVDDETVMLREKLRSKVKVIYKNRSLIEAF